MRISTLSRNGWPPPAFSSASYTASRPASQRAMVNPPPSSGGGSGVSALWRTSTRNVPPYCGRVAADAPRRSSAAIITLQNTIPPPPRASAPSPETHPLRAEGHLPPLPPRSFSLLRPRMLSQTVALTKLRSPRLRASASESLSRASQRIPPRTSNNIFTLSTAVHRDHVSLVAAGGEVADHGKGCVAAEAPERSHGARQIQRRGERDGCLVD